MPGIVGLITKQPRSSAEPQLLAMLKTICHESFYSTGTWVDEQSGIYVGWAALKGSFSDGMPLCNEKEDVHLIFSGEEYPNPQTVNELRSRGHSLGTSEAGYLVHSYEEDSSFVENLNGVFHGLIADNTRKVATLFNDRYGMQRLYYHESRDAFYFAAEAKAILAVCPELRVIDPRGLGELVSCGCVLENRSVFKNIGVLPPGSAWTFRNGAIEHNSSYFDPKDWEDQGALDLESYYQ